MRQRAAGRCEYCRIPQAAVPWARFHIKHILPRQHGGGDEPDNLALACRRLCKGPNLASVDPDTGQITSLFHPRRDVWSEHFALSTHRIIGITPAGRATAALLDMNDQDRVQLRAELNASGREVI